MRPIQPSWYPGGDVSDDLVWLTKEGKEGYLKARPTWLRPSQRVRGIEKLTVWAHDGAWYVPGGGEDVVLGLILGRLERCG